MYIFCRLKVSKKESRPSKSASHVTIQQKSIGARFDDNEDDEGEEPFTENHSTQADSESTQTSGMDSLSSSLSMGISDAGFLYKRLKVFITFEVVKMKLKVKLHFLKPITEITEPEKTMCLDRLMPFHPLFPGVL